MTASDIGERAYWLAWSQIKGVGPVTIKHLWEHFGALALAWQAPAGELLTVDGIGLLIADKIVSLRRKINPAELLAQHEKANKAFWTPADPDYPALLFAINDPPPLLYYRGALRPNDMPDALTVGIVGTRLPSPYGQRWTRRLSSRLTQQGAIIVSGLAAGIDTEAHTSCLQHQGQTIAVVGTGVDQVYPASNRSLHAQIATAGLIVSEYPDGTGPDKKHFPQRNRIIAGLSRAVLVTEAPARSGALITSRLANEYCREVYALPCGLDSLQGEGCLNLINQGGQMILGEQSLVDALAEIPSVEAILPGRLPGRKVGQANAQREGVTTQEGQASDRTEGVETRRSSSSAVLATSASGPSVQVDKLSPVLKQVLEAVPIEPTVLDQIVHGSQVDIGKVLGALLELELLGLITQLPGMQYQRC